MLNVFFPLRIAFKADLIMNNLEQTYNIDFGKRGPSDVSHGELKFVCQVDFLSFFLTIGASTRKSYDPVERAPELRCWPCQSPFDFH